MYMSAVAAVVQTKGVFSQKKSDGGGQTFFNTFHPPAPPRGVIFAARRFSLCSVRAPSAHPNAPRRKGGKRAAASGGRKERPRARPARGVG